MEIKAAACPSVARSLCSCANSGKRKISAKTNDDDEWKERMEWNGCLVHRSIPPREGPNGHAFTGRGESEQKCLQRKKSSSIFSWLVKEGSALGYLNSLLGPAVSSTRNHTTLGPLY